MKSKRKQITLKMMLVILLALVLLVVQLPVRIHAASIIYPEVGRSLTKSTGLNIRKSATTNSAVSAKLDPGAYIQVIGESGDFYKVIYSTTGSVGYCAKSYISIVSDVSGSVTTNGGTLNLRRSPTTASSVLTRLPNGTVLPVLSDTTTGWLKVVFGKTVGYIYDDYFTQTNVSSASDASDKNTEIALSSVRNAMIDTAQDYLGTYYEWGGDFVGNPSSYGFDCSHFTYRVMKTYDLIDYYRTASNQYSWCTKITKDELLPGDLIFYKSSSSGAIVHVTMYLGDGLIIGANGGTSSTNTISRAISRNAMVKIQPLESDSRTKLYGRAPKLN